MHLANNVDKGRNINQNTNMQKAFCLSHILYLVFSVGIIITVLVLIYKFCKTKNSKEIAIFISAVLLFSALVWNRISIAVIGDGPQKIPDARNLMPFSYCALASLLLAVLAVICRKSREHGVFHCIVYLAFVGGLAVTIFPGMVLGNGDSTIFATRTFSGLVYHSLAMFMALVLVVTGVFRPDWRKWWCLLLGLCAFITFGLFQIHVFNMADSMYINIDIVNGMKWYFAGPTMMAIFFTLALCYEYIPKFLKARKTRDANEVAV